MEINERKIKFDKVTIGLSEGVKDGLWYLINEGYWLEMMENGGDILITLQDNVAFCRKIILKGVTELPQDRTGFFLQSCHIEKRENKYCIYGELEEPIYGNIEKFSICFEDVKESVEIYNCIQNTGFNENPWNHIGEVAAFIVMKSRLSGDFCNALEMEMLPLLEELAALQLYVETEVANVTEFPTLKNIALTCDEKELLKKLNKLETEADIESKYRINANSIIFSLCEKKWESVWREIYSKLKESQKDYKDKVKATCKEELIYRIRKEIQDMMEYHGYVGEYPDFVRMGNIKGIHLEQSYDVTYFVGPEKNVVHHIHCIETVEEHEYLTVQFLCGTAFLKENEAEEDIYGCLFNAKGKRLFYTLHAYLKIDENDRQREISELEETINLAVKKTELKRLTKKEKIKYRGIGSTGGVDFLLLFILCGGIFAILMTVGMLLLSVIMTVVFGQADKIPSLLAETSWWIILIIGWGGFAGALGIITMLAKRK